LSPCNQVIGKVVKSEDIPAATQLFTPNWIVKYMVQNSLGATWLATYPNSPLKGQMEFYIEPAEQTEEVQAQLAAITPESLDPEALTLIDPACGSGHILVEAYDLLRAIYLERGYRQRDIPELILSKNLYGLDICPRAAQLASFSLLMKGREDDRRLLERGVNLNVITLLASKGLKVDNLLSSIDPVPTGISRFDISQIIEIFKEADVLGSLVEVPENLTPKIPLLQAALSTAASDCLVDRKSRDRLGDLALQASVMARKYDAVVTNPPYMGNKFQNTRLKMYLKCEYAGYDKDTFSSFIMRCISLSKNGGRLAFMVPYVWMFISSYEKLRNRILETESIKSLIQLEYSGFEGATVPICTFCLQHKRAFSEVGTYIRLANFRGAANQPLKVLEAINSQDASWLHRARQSTFRGIPGAPIAYWISDSVKKMFKLRSIRELSISKGQNKTGDNARFVRLWWEPSSKSVGKGKKWVMYAKGGPFRKWYGNLEYIVDWSESALSYYRSSASSTVASDSVLFKPGITWSVITSGKQSFRLLLDEGTFDMTGSSIFFANNSDLIGTLGFLNSKTAEHLLSLLNPTLALQIKNVRDLPSASFSTKEFEHYVKECILIAENDYNRFETANRFKRQSLLEIAGCNRTVEDAFKVFEKESGETTLNMADAEQYINRVVADAFDLAGEIESTIPLNEVTLSVNPLHRYSGDSTAEFKGIRFRQDTIAELISYVIGCMMGRYSLDQAGLILADSRDSQAEQLAAYEDKVGKAISHVQFEPDPDGIIPVLDGEWFEDDIVARTREFLAVTFPESSVAENLRFIEESLGKDIRKYFCSEFYKDHLQTYKKRPIYWMVQSPKKGFACLIYLHRYTKDTLNQVLNNYFRPYLQKLEARLAQLGLDQLNDDLPARERTAARKEAEKITKVLKECQAWEQDALLPLAQQRIELDLDDGVKVNYLKLQDVLALIPGLAAKED
jgi:type II restriction/modification system DNA methylase subunit YeeA